MDKWLKRFSAQYRERLLDLSWRQWITLGVPGHAQTISPSLIDPDALLIFSCFIARYDQRLFDEMLEWLAVNGALLNIQRLKRILPNTSETAHPVFGAVAFWLRKRGAESKWASLSQPHHLSGREQSLFFLKEGKPMPALNKPDPVFLERGLLRNEIRLRNRGKSFSPEHPANLLLRLRAFFGVNSRADLAAYLLTHEEANAYEMARACWFSQRAVHDALTEMRRSQLVHSAEKGREIVYFIQRDRWDPFLKVLPPLPEWRNWPLIFSLLSRIHEKLTEERIMQASVEALNSELILFARGLEKVVYEAGLSKTWMQNSPEAASQGSEALEKIGTAILDEIGQ